VKSDIGNKVERMIGTRKYVKYRIWLKWNEAKGVIKEPSVKTNHRENNINPR